MPIKPENQARYPANWLEIRERIRARAQNTCEKCGVPNHAKGGRLPSGLFLHALPYEGTLPAEGTRWYCGDHERGEYMRIIKIVCTVAHLDHQPENCADENLMFLCQRCHLLHDNEQHRTNAAQTRREGKAIGDLFT